MALIKCNHFSYYLGMDMDMMVLLPEKRQQPPVLSAEKKYPVLYLLHGHSDDCTSYIRKSLIELLVRNQDLVVVMPAAHRSFYTDAEQGHLYYSYISEELPVHVANFFPVSTRPEDTYIAGISMGGYGAMKLALTHPKRYAGVGCISGAVALENMKERQKETLFTVPDFFENLDRIFGNGSKKPQDDLFHLLRMREQEGGFQPRIYQCCGTGDRVYQANVKFRDAVRALSGTWDYTYEEGSGQHDWDFWNEYLPKMLKHFGFLEKDGLGVVRTEKSCQI